MASRSTRFRRPGGAPGSLGGSGRRITAAGWGTCGTTVLRALYAAVALAAVAFLLVPALSSYQATAQMRGAALQFSSDILQAQEIAITTNRTTTIQIGTVGAGGKWVVRQSGRILWSNSFPPNVHGTSHCLRTSLSPTGSVSDTRCTGSPMTLLCVDNHAGARAVSIQVQMAVGTGKVNLVQGKGSCV